MSKPIAQKFSVWTLTSMVVGSMVGAGIFSLPQHFGRATGPFGALVAWTVAGFGMLMLAFVFLMLSRRKPELDAGIFAYAKAGFGHYLGFFSALGYWAAACLGNVTYFILIQSTLGAVFPILGEGNTVAAVLSSSLILWSFHFMILRGIKEAAVINTIVTVAKIIPIVLFLVLVVLGFQRDIFVANFWGGTAFDWGSIFEQVRSTMLVTVFVFLGIEGASVYSRYAKNRNDVGIATMLGFVGVLCLLVLVTVLSYGILLRPDLAALRNPSMAGVLQAVVGPWGAVLVSVGLLISVLGAYLSWCMLAAEVLYSAARSETMPAFLHKENANKVPSAALWMTNITVQVFLVLTVFAEEAFTLAKELTGSMSLIPYLLVAAYGFKLSGGGAVYAPAEDRQRRVDRIRSVLATVFTIWLIYAGGLKYLLLSAVVYGPGSLLFIITRREQGKQIFTPLEWLLFGASMLGAGAAVYGLISGSIVI